MPQVTSSVARTGRSVDGESWPYAGEVVSKAPSLDVALAAGATCVAGAFALILLDRWLRRRRPYDQAWAISLALFGIGTGALWWGFARGWSADSFRVFFLAGAILNVPWLALGTVYLLAGRSFGDRTKAWLVGLSGVAVGVIWVAPIKGTVPSGGLPQGKEHFGALPRIFAAVGSGVAAMVIIGGAVWSAWRMWRARSPSVTGSASTTRPNGALGNVVIAVGTLMLASAGTLNARLGAARAFAVTTLVGIIVLFAGFVITSAKPRARAKPTAGSAAGAETPSATVTRSVTGSSE